MINNVPDTVSEYIRRAQGHAKFPPPYPARRRAIAHTEGFTKADIP